MKDINNIEVIDHEIVKPQQEIVEETRLQCIKCFKPIDEIEECDMCLSNTEIEQFYIIIVKMNQETYLKKFKETVDKMYEITKTKNADYAGENSVDAFKNFRVIEQL